VDRSGHCWSVLVPAKATLADFCECQGGQLCTAELQNYAKVNVGRSTWCTCTAQMRPDGLALETTLTRLALSVGQCAGSGSCAHIKMHIWSCQAWSNQAFVTL